MNTAVNPDMLQLARDIRGMTQSELSTRSKISQSKISKYEGGLATVDENDLVAMARALHFPAEFFFQHGKRYGAEPVEVFHRKRQSVPASERKRIHALVDLHRLGSERLLMAFELGSISTIPVFRLSDYRDASEIAQMVRAYWRMPDGPVIDLIGWLEYASCLVFSYAFSTDKIDEVVQYIDPAPPIIIVNRAAPADRVRFSLAHALGHLVLHRGLVPYPEMEKEADQFASAFLMPYDDIIDEILPVSIQRMLELKQRWQVSMASLIYRARDLGAITERRYRSLFQQLSRLGYRKNEPFPITREQPRSVKALLDAHKKLLRYSDEDLARLLYITVEDLYKWYYPFDKVVQFSSAKALRASDKAAEIDRVSHSNVDESSKPRILHLNAIEKIPPSTVPRSGWKDKELPDSEPLEG